MLSFLQNVCLFLLIGWIWFVEHALHVIFYNTRKMQPPNGGCHYLVPVEGWDWPLASQTWPPASQNCGYAQSKREIFKVGNTFIIFVKLQSHLRYM